MTNARNIEAGGAYVRLFTEESGLVRGLRSADKRFHDWASKINTAGKTLLTVGLAASAPLLTSVKVFADQGSALNDLSARTGAATDALQRLSFAAKMTGSDAEALEAGIRKLGKNIGEALGGDKAANEMFAGFGLSARQLSGLSLDDQFELIADRLSQIPEGALRTKATMDLLGKSGTALLPMLSGGADELAAYGKRLEELGVIKTPQAIAAADDLGDRLDEVGLVLQHTAFVVGDALAPMVTKLADNVIELAVSANEWIEENEGVITTVALVAAGVGVAGASLLVLGTATHVVSAGFGMMATAAVAVANPLVAIPLAAGAIGAVLVTQTNVGTAALEELEATATSTWQGITDAVAGNDLALAADVALAGLNVVWATGLAKLETTYADTMDRIREKTLTTTIVGEIGSVLNWDHGFKKSLDEEIKGQKIERDQAANAEIAKAQKQLDDLKKKAADQKAKADDRNKKPSSKKHGRGDDQPVTEAAKAGGGPRQEATTSGITASLNRSFAGKDTPATEMSKLGNATDVTTRKIDEQAAALKRRNAAAVAPPAAAKPLPEPPAPKAEDQKQAAEKPDAKAEREKKRQAIIAARWEKRWQDSGAADQGMTKEEWVQSQKDEALGKFNKGRAESFSEPGERQGFGAGQYVPRGAGLSLPGRDDTRGRGKYLKDANAQLSDQTGGYGLGERLAAMRNVRSQKGFPGNTPLATIKQRYPEEVAKELQTNRDKNLLAGTMPDLELRKQAGKETHSRGDTTEFRPGKIVSTNRGPHDRQMAELNLKIADADANAKAFAGMAKDKPQTNQTPTLITSPQQALPVSAEGQAAIDATRNLTAPLQSLTDRLGSLELKPLDLSALESRLSGLRMPSLDPPPTSAVEQTIVQSVANSGGNEKLDAMLDQLKTLNANLRSMGTLA